MSIKSYTILFSCCIVVVAIAIFAASMLSYLSGITEAELVERGRLRAVAIESLIGQDIALNDQTRVVNTCQEMLERSEDIKYISICLPEGTSLLFQSGGEWRTGDAAKWKPYQGGSDRSVFIKSPAADGEVLQYSHPIRYYGSLDLGWLHVGMSPHSYHEHMADFRARTTGMAFAALTFGISASLLFGRFFTRPIIRLQDFAEGVADGDLDSRVDAGGSKEIVQLAETMNWMTDRLAETQARMKDSMKKEASLREKEILLREIHHRVKNNMQILGGLIRLQCRTLKSGEARDVLIESETRIRSMALLHQKLYQSDSISEISLRDYVTVLVSELRRLYASDRSPIEISIDVPATFALDLDTALPCGLIINELVSNSLKYAFRDRTAGGEIRIAIEPGLDGYFAMIIEDNGVGLPNDFDLENATSLGLRLVNMLVEQLDGTVLTKNTPGCRFQMELLTSAYAERT